MPRKHTLKIYVSLFLLLISLQACDVPSITYGQPTSTPTPGTTDDIALDTWVKTAPGIELRREHWKSPGNNEDTVLITRFDLTNRHLSIGYQNDKPLTMSEWMQQTQASAIINGGYFDDHNRPTGLLISDGSAFGASYRGFGGMLSVDSQKHVVLRSLRNTPYNSATEHLQQATQSSPMLMLDGKRTDFDSNAASQRRSVVATDKQGRLLFIVSSAQAFSLDEMADLLAASDLSLKSALNLDGGASTGLYVNGTTRVTLDAFTTLPIVIIVK